MPRNKRKVNKVSRKKQTTEGRKIIRDTPSDTAAANLMAELYADDIKSVGNTSDLNKAFKRFAKKNNIKGV